MEQILYLLVPVVLSCKEMNKAEGIQVILHTFPYRVTQIKIHIKHRQAQTYTHNQDVHTNVIYTQRKYTQTTHTNTYPIYDLNEVFSTVAFQILFCFSILLLNLWASFIIFLFSFNKRGLLFFIWFLVSIKSNEFIHDVLYLYVILILFIFYSC